MAAIPTLPVVMYDENETIVASTPAGYWQALWDGFQVSGPVPPPARSEVPAHLSDLDTVEAKIPSTASLSATFARKGGRSVAAMGADFRRQVVDAPTGTYDYASAPGTIDTLDGDILVGYRIGSRHDLTSSGLPGTVVVRKSTNGGQSFSSSITVASFASGNDVGDVSLYRAPGARRVYLATWETAAGGGSSTGLYLSYSDDDGGTWSTPAKVYAQEAAFGSGPRLIGSTWYWPIYRKVSGFWRATLLTATDPLGAWNALSDGYAPASADATEWDFVQVSTSNWVGVVRGGGGTTVGIVQSTDLGATWSAPVALPTTLATYDGWPHVALGLDGRVLCFVRAIGKGIRILQLLDTSAPLTAANWAEGGYNGGLLITLDNGTGGNFAGSWKPVRIGTVWVGAYQVETTVNEASEIRFGRLDEKVLRGGYSHVTASEKIADAAAVGFGQQLATIDRVKIRSVGGLYKVSYRVKSNQLTGTVSDYQVDVAIDGVQSGSSQPLYVEVEGATRAVGRWYYDTAEGVIYLAPGYHTIDLWQRQSSTVVGRTFKDRTLLVEPWAA